MASSKKVISIHAIREREADRTAIEEAHNRGEAVMSRLEPHKPKLQYLARQARSEVRLSRKIRLVRQMAEYLSEAAAGISPCASGCSHCCAMPITITRAEAVTIADEIGVPAQVPEVYTDEIHNEYRGKPCPFLSREGLCSIYEFRPIACRTHFSLDRDALLCEIIEGEVIAMPRFPTIDFQLVLLQALGMEQGGKIADLRDFFPNGLRTDQLKLL